MRSYGTLTNGRASRQGVKSAKEEYGLFSRQGAGFLGNAGGLDRWL